MVTYSIIWLFCVSTISCHLNHTTIITIIIVFNTRLCSVVAKAIANIFSLWPIAKYKVMSERPKKRARPTDDDRTQSDDVSDKQNSSSSAMVDGKPAAKRSAVASAGPSTTGRRNHQQSKKAKRKRVAKYGNYDRFRIVYLFFVLSHHFVLTPTCSQTKVL